MTTVAYLNEIIHALKTNHERMAQLEESTERKFLTSRSLAAYQLLNNHQSELYYFIERLQKKELEKESANKPSTSPKE